MCFTSQLSFPLNFLLHSTALPDILSPIPSPLLYSSPENVCSLDLYNMTVMRVRSYILISDKCLFLSKWLSYIISEDICRIHIQHIYPEQILVLSQSIQYYYSTLVYQKAMLSISLRHMPAIIAF